ncbi:Tyrosine recombinase XerC [hydrothermal vent metagenome]|uniref:Tyrosine recombinase XerC n=1 Tax=hydrothermal vent metagenome TaxID=652676 RepID=A0A1W1D4N9_9ZZZZ
MKKFIDKERKKYLLHLEEIRGYSDLTIKSYDEALQEILSLIEIEKDTSGIMVFDLMPFRLHVKDLNNKTISKKLSAIRGFVHYLNENGAKVELKADESIKVAKTLPKPIAHQKIQEALSLANEEEKLVVIMLYTLGLRISELANLKLSDISSEWIRVTGKGNKQRDIPLLQQTKQMIQSYLEHTHPKIFLFEKDGDKLSENSLRYKVHKVFKRISLKVTPHQLRHSYATELLNHGAPIVDVSELLGHASMATTQIYTKLGSALKQQNYKKAHPLCGVDAE